MSLERREFVVDSFRIEAREGSAPLMIGHAAVFNRFTTIGGMYDEQVAPGAFADAIKEDDVRALFNHDPNFVLGRNKSNTLRMKEDDAGLHVEIDLPDTQVSRDLQTSVKRGDISGMSFGFSVRKGGQKWEEVNGKTQRTLTAVRLYDVSPVTYPAYPQTDVAMRMLEEYQKERGQNTKEFEQSLARYHRAQALRFGPDAQK